MEVRAALIAMSTTTVALQHSTCHCCRMIDVMKAGFSKAAACAASVALPTCLCLQCCAATAVCSALLGCFDSSCTHTGAGAILSAGLFRLATYAEAENRVWNQRCRPCLGPCFVLRCGLLTWHA